jgi:hypothetical protein
MAKVSEITEPYFSHDIAARQDEKILKMFFSFRKQAKEMTREELESLAALSSYGLFWSIVEYMHRNPLAVSDSDVIADDLRISEKFVKMVLDDFELFRKENEQYVSDRILKNINKQEEKSSASSKAAKARWVLSKLKSDYTEIYGFAPVLSDKEIAIFLKYSEQIEGFKDNLADYLYTVKGLKFDNNPNFNPSINWLLTENHLPKLVNGEYGKLKSWAKEVARRKAIEKQKQEEQAAEEENSLDIETVCNRVDAVNILVKYSNWIKAVNRLHINPYAEPLLKKFDIDKAEIKELKLKELEVCNG